MNRIEWKLMEPDDIEIRPAQVKDGKATLLAYQNGRNTMNALDEQFGEFGWKVEYKDVAGQIYGRLSIKDPETGEWIYKEDTGEESNISASKGMSTDILKRLAVRFGYGRELYTIPRIVVDDDGYGCKWQVGEIAWDKKRNCTHLTLTNKFGKVMFKWDKEKEEEEECVPVENNRKPRKMNSDILREFCAEKKKEDGVDKDELVKFYKWYEKRVDEYTNVLKPEIIWDKWQTTKR